MALRLLSDARLTRLAAAGSEGAMAAIFERHHQALQRYCHSIVGNSHDAADALQNTMIKALGALPGEQRQIALRPWLYRIAHNESISLLRARRSDSDLDAAQHVSDLAADGALESRERLRSLTEDLAELTERQRGALLMRELGGLEFSEVAEALNTSAPAVKESVYEARRALQAMQEGRAMDCEAIRRTMSDGDRRSLRAMRMRGHLRACAGCRDFQTAMHQRPAQLGAIIPPLPLAAAAAMLYDILGAASSAAVGGGGGGGLAAGIIGGAKSTTGFSLGAKTAAVVAASATLAGGAAYTIPKLDSVSPGRAAPSEGTPRSQSAAPAIAAHRQRSQQAVATSSRADGDVAWGDTTSATRNPAGTDDPAGNPDSTPGVNPDGTPPVDSGSGTPGATADGTPAVDDAAGQPAVTPGGPSAVTPGGKPAGTPGPSIETPQPPAGTPVPDSIEIPGPPASTPGPATGPAVASSAAQRAP